MKTTNRRLVLAASVFLLSFMITCVKNINDTEIAGNTETENVAGILYNPGGTPAANAKLRFISTNHNPDPRKTETDSVYTTNTDENGAYSLDSVPADTFNVTAQGDSGVLFSDSVIINPEDTSQTRKDTLGDPGSLHGVVGLKQGGSPLTVFILVLGTEKYTAPDSAGNFSLSDMADGKYNARIISTLDDYLPLDTNLSVTGGEVNSLEDTLWLEYTGIPTPQGVELSYDTMLQIVTLTWDKADTGLVSGYNVYRQHVDSGLVKLNSAPIADTVFRDSTALQDNSYTYQVKSVDKTGNEGDLSEGKEVEVVSVIERIDTLVTLERTSSSMDLYEGKIYSVVPLNLEGDSSALHIYDTTGKLLKSWKIPGGALNVFNQISVINSNKIIFVNNSDGIIVLDSSGNIIQSWKPDIHVKSFCATDSTLFLGGFSSIVTEYTHSGDSVQNLDKEYIDGDVDDIGVDFSNIYITVNPFNYEDAKILKYDLEGNYIGTIIEATGYTGGLRINVQYEYIYFEYKKKYFLFNTEGTLKRKWHIPGYQSSCGIIANDSGTLLYVQNSFGIWKISLL